MTAKPDAVPPTLWKTPVSLFTARKMDWLIDNLPLGVALMFYIPTVALYVLVSVVEWVVRVVARKVRP